MLHHMRRLAFALAAFALAFACAGVGLPQAGWADEAPGVAAPAGLQPIVILHTNDVHCNVDASSTTIGYAGLAAAVKDAEATYGASRVTLVDAGDATQGKPIGTLSRGSYLVDIMNNVGYDVAIPGNHEFDYGMSRLFQLSAQAAFPYVSCNFTDLRTHDTVYNPYHIVDYGDVKVAYVGISTPESLTKSSPANFKDADGTYIYGFCQDETGQALYACVQQAVDAARAAGANYVIAVGHLGEEGVATRWRSDTVIANTSGIDAFIDGHSHEAYEQSIANKDGKDVPLVQTGTQLQAYGKIVIDPAANTITTSLAYPPTAQDPDTAAFVKNIEDQLADVLDRKVATSLVYLKAIDYDANGQQVAWAARKRETNLGDLVADAYRSTLGADIGLANGGGIRADIAAGSVTCGDLISAQPFANALCLVRASGQTLLDALEMASRLYPESTGGFLQTSGLTYEIRSDIPSSVVLGPNNTFVEVAGPRRIQNVRVNGVPIDASQRYTVASIPYLLIQGGDGFTMFQDSEVIIAEQGLDYEALTGFIVNNLNGTIGTDYENVNGAGRILVKSGPDPAPTPTPTPIDPGTQASGEVAGTALASTGDNAATATATSAIATAAFLCACTCAFAQMRRKRDARHSESSRIQG